MFFASSHATSVVTTFLATSFDEFIFLSERVSVWNHEQGHVSAALVLGGYDINGPQLSTVYPHGSTDSNPYVTMGSGMKSTAVRCIATRTLSSS